jgi:hypothetical protein
MLLGLPPCVRKDALGARSCQKRESVRGQPNARFLACPKSYEFEALALQGRITSFCLSYQILV